MESNKNNIFCAILNYGKKDNALNLLSRCEKQWDTFIFDSYSIEHGFDSNSLQKSDSDSIKFFDNIYCGGLTVKVFEHVKEFNYKYVLIITSDLQIDYSNLQKLVSSVNLLPYSKIGIYEVTATDNSAVMGVVGRIPYTSTYFKGNKNRFKPDGRAEGWVYAIRCELTNKIVQFLDVDKNKYGWGIGGVMARLSEEIGLKNVIDDEVVVYHPKGTGYNTDGALEEWHRMDMDSEKIGAPYEFMTIGYATREHNEKFLDYITNVFGNKQNYIEKICNEDTNLTLTEAYNQIISESKYNTILLIHDDIEFLDINKWHYHATEIIQKLFFRNKDCGILGIAPRCILEPDIIQRNYEPEYFFAEKLLLDGSSRAYFGGRNDAFSENLSKDAVVDGFFTAIRKDRIKSLYDENLKKFHCYDLDFCLSNYLSGVGVYTTKALYVRHKETPQDSFNEYFKTKEFLHEKYKESLPIKLEK